MAGIFKWVGSKWRTIDLIKTHFPAADRLVDPFAGSLSTLMKTEYKDYWMNDNNLEVISFYLHTLKNPTQVMKAIDMMFCDGNTRDKYNMIRNKYNNCTQYDLRSMMLLYLNRHAFNGLCRYSKSGKFNTPFGRYAKTHQPINEINELVDKADKCNIKWTTLDFELVMNETSEGDLVYCDPPYTPISKTANFAEYLPGGFSKEDHARLVETSKRCVQRGVPVIISNNDTEETRELYKDARIVELTAPRSVSAGASGRAVVKEVLAIYE